MSGDDEGQVTLSVLLQTLNAGSDSVRCFDVQDGQSYVVIIEGNPSTMWRTSDAFSRFAKQRKIDGVILFVPPKAQAQVFGREALANMDTASRTTVMRIVGHLIQAHAPEASDLLSAYSE